VKFKKLVYPFLRKFLKLDPIPKYEEKGNKYIWGMTFVSTLVIGIREDTEIVGTFIDDLGWTHEAI